MKSAAVQNILRNFEMKTTLDRILLVKAVEATMGVINPRTKAALLEDGAYFM